MGGGSILLLSVLGRRSGKLSVVPLMYLRDGATYVVVASNMGASRHPDWALNLRANPHGLMVVGDAAINAKASEADGPERDRLWSELLKISPFLAQHQQKTSRTIPIFVLRPLGQQ